MALISLQDISLAFGGPLLFDGMDFQIDRGERVALLGRNGAGKTTLMKVMSSEQTVTSGKRVLQKGIRVTHLPQEVPTNMEGTVFDVALSGLTESVKILQDYHRVSHRLETEYSEKLLNQLGVLQAEIDRTGGWEIQRRVEDAVSHMKLDPDSRFELLSGGQKRRALLARALVIEPDVLLLDEPTNHLDIESIDWLEGFLRDSFNGTLIFVTHDRTFMQNLATRIVELDRGRLFSWACDYKTFLERKQMALDAEAAEQARFDKKLAQEEIWIRQGIKARRTRNEGRVRELQQMREKKRAQRQAVGRVRMQTQDAERSGQRVIKAEHISHSYDGQCLIRDFSTRIMREDKIGVIGPNGSGKTTLLRILLGRLKPQKGSVTLGTNLQVSYFDQLREQLDENKTVAENVCESGETVVVNGRPRHIMGYLQDFLFAPARARTKVKVLSGGERNRLLLARLFTKPSNVLVMDEPTNDLDIETLELLEELLAEYAGTLLLVSHDRAFLNHVVTSTMVLEEDGSVREYPGGYDDWVAQRPAKQDPAADKAKAEPAPRAEKKKTAPGLNNREKRKLEKLTREIEKLENEQKAVYEAMSRPEFHINTPEAEAAEALRRAETLADELARLYARWEELESRNS